MSATCPDKPASTRPPASRRHRTAANTGCKADHDRWATIRYALDSNARTVRLCIITVVTAVPLAVITWLLGLRHLPKVNCSRHSWAEPLSRWRHELVQGRSLVLVGLHGIGMLRR
jgi:hypothetical protein